MSEDKIRNWLILVNEKKETREYLNELKNQTETIQNNDEFKEELKHYFALGNKIRLSIFKLLESNALCICVLAKLFDLKESTITHHMKILEKAGLVVGFKKGLYTAYYTKENLIDELTK